MQQQHETQIRVRYSETDKMGYLHHSHYLTYFEIGRTELYRAQGGNYRRMEENGLYFVVARMNVQYKSPARYDDLLTIRTTVTRITPAKLEHLYEVFRDGELITRAESLLACVDSRGVIQRIPTAIEETIRSEQAARDRQSP